MTLHDIAFISAALFLFGVGLASVEVPFFLLCFAVAAFALFMFFGKGPMAEQLPKSPLVPLLLLLLLAGYGYYAFRDVRANTLPPLDAETEFSGTIIADPIVSEKSQQFAFKLDAPSRGEVRIYTDPFADFSYGDSLHIKGTIEKAPSGAFYMVGFPEITKTSDESDFSIRRSLFAFRHAFVGNINAALDSDQAALLSGITVGDRSGFTKEFKNDMALSGTTHIVALSGYNISILAIAISYLFGSFLSKQKSFYLTVAVIVLFVVMTGAEASVVRAAIMGGLALFAERAGRLYSFRNALTLAAFVMVIWNPHVLLSDVGFQLSFGALIGIVYIKPVLEKILGLKNKDEGFLGWRGNALATFSAQLAVVPIILYNFGSLNLLSLLANMLILGLQPYTMALGFALGFVGFLSGMLAHILGWVTAPLLIYQIAVIRFFAAYPFAIQVAVFPFTLWIIYYFLLAFALFSLRYKKLFTEGTL